MAKTTLIIICLATVVVLVSGCDPLITHKVTSTIFDGVPSMPSPEQYCKDYHEQATLDELAAERIRQKKVVQEVSHSPYAGKRCNDCHDKNTDSGFVTAADALCTHCHKDFFRGAFQHGPAAVGACLKCHLPHSSPYPNLLSKPPEIVCDACHAEARLASKLHITSLAKGMVCSNCHDPHGGNDRFFLK
jgi:predicted CXXCH cytochrome family protein